MDTIGPLELVIILVIVLLLFGVGRIGKIAGELGSGIRQFKQGLEGDDPVKTPARAESQPVEMVSAANAAAEVAVPSEGSPTPQKQTP